MATYYKSLYLAQERAIEILKAVGKHGVTENDLILNLRGFMVSEKSISKFLDRLIEAGKLEKKNDLYFLLKEKHEKSTAKLTKEEQNLLKIAEN